MKRSTRLLFRNLFGLAWIVLSTAMPVAAQAENPLLKCADFGFSTEEDFLAREKQYDGSALVSDGDVLAKDGVVCMRNRELLRVWEIKVDLGLDALDIVNADKQLLVFSTELDDPKGRFGAGDLLATNGAIIPNKALLQRFQVSHNLGLDGLQLSGESNSIEAFLAIAAEKGRDYWLEGGVLSQMLDEFGIDVLFTVEGTERKASALPIYDGDLLSAQTGTIVFSQNQLLAAPIPAGIPQKGVDFGLDGIALPRLQLDRERTFLSTEILFRKDPKFTDGDMLRLGGSVAAPNRDLLGAFAPKASFLGLDAIHIAFASDRASTNGNELGRGSGEQVFLPVVSR